MSNITKLVNDLAKAHPDRTLIVVLPATHNAPVEGEEHKQTVVLFGNEDIAAKATTNLRCRAQSTVNLSRLSFYGSTEPDNIFIKSMWVGDEPIFADEQGVAITRFADEHLACVVDGWTLNAGTDLMIVAFAQVSAKLVVNVISTKPKPKPSKRPSAKHDVD